MPNDITDPAEQERIADEILKKQNKARLRKKRELRKEFFAAIVCFLLGCMITLQGVSILNDKMESAWNKERPARMSAVGEKIGAAHENFKKELTDFFEKKKSKSEAALHENDAVLHLKMQLELAELEAKQSVERQEIYDELRAISKERWQWRDCANYLHNAFLAAIFVTIVFQLLLIRDTRLLKKESE